MVRRDRPDPRAHAPAEAAELYGKGTSACEIAEAYGITGVAPKPTSARAASAASGGAHRAYEELRHVNAEAVSYMVARWGAAEEEA